MVLSFLLSGLLSLIPGFVWLWVFGVIICFVAILGLRDDPAHWGNFVLLFLFGAGFFSLGVLALRLGFWGGHVRGGGGGGGGGGSLGGSGLGGGGSSGGGGAGRQLPL